MCLTSPQKSKSYSQSVKTSKEKLSKVTQKAKPNGLLFDPLTQFFSPNRFELQVTSCMARWVPAARALCCRSKLWSLRRDPKRQRTSQGLAKDWICGLPQTSSDQIPEYFWWFSEVFGGFSVPSHLELDVGT